MLQVRPSPLQEQTSLQRAAQIYGTCAFIPGGSSAALHTELCILKEKRR